MLQRNRPQSLVVFKAGSFASTKIITTFITMSLSGVCYIKTKRLTSARTLMDIRQGDTHAKDMEAGKANKVMN
jgi:hypothetical protein